MYVRYIELMYYAPQQTGSVYFRLHSYTAPIGPPLTQDTHTRYLPMIPLTQDTYPQYSPKILTQDTYPRYLPKILTQDTCPATNRFKLF